MSEKIKVLLLGGCGFLGRHVLSELVNLEKVESIVVVDKVPPQMAWLNAAHRKNFDHSKVVYKSANLINKVSCEAVFQEDFDWVINAASETKPGQDELIYKEGILKLSSNVIQLSAVKGVKVYLEISSGQMNSSEKEPMTEVSECSPWSQAAKFKREVEKTVMSTSNLNWIILRPAIMYGPGDKIGLTPRLLVGAVSRFTGNEMKLLWDESLKTNTVHVGDVARAIVWLCENAKTGQVFNLVDEAESTQGSITKLISSIFQVKCDFYGNAFSKLAMSDGHSTTEMANEKHLEPWLKMCTANGITNTPLSPYVDVEALENKHVNLEGSKIRREGFEFKWPKPTIENLKEVLDDFIAMELLPKDIYGSGKSSK